MIGDKLDIDDEASFWLWRQPHGWYGAIVAWPRRSDRWVAQVLRSDGLLLCEVEKTCLGRAFRSIDAHLKRLCTRDPLDDFAAEARRRVDPDVLVRIALRVDYNHNYSPRGSPFDIQTNQPAPLEEALDEVLEEAKRHEDELGYCISAKGRLITPDMITERLPR